MNETEVVEIGNGQELLQGIVVVSRGMSYRNVRLTPLPTGSRQP
jgi:hypothetical protein